MSDQYLDEIEKIKYYKERIIDRFLSNGISADKEKVQEYLDRIDLKLSIFSQAYIQSGHVLSVDVFNEQKRNIYADLVILYRILYNLANQRVEKVRTRMRYELDDLRQLAKEFQYIVDGQTVSVYGKTVFSKTSDFPQEYKDGQVIIDLGTVTVSSGSYLAPMIASQEFDSSDVLFIFTDPDGTEIQASPYNYGKNYVKITGNYSLNTVSYAYADKVLGKELVNVNGGVSANSRYNLLINKDQIAVRSLANNGFRYQAKSPEIYYQSAGQEEVTFYVYGATKIQLHLFGDIMYQNFSGNEIIAPKQRQKIVLRGDGFSFDLKTDGTVYADMIYAVPEGDALRITKNFEDVTDYTVEEIQYGDDLSYQLRVVINNAESPFYDISYIVIKQARISELEDIE